MPRLFTGLEFPFRISERLSALQNGLHGAKWIAPSDLHLTLRFIGDVDRETAREIHEGLDKMRANIFELRLSSLDVFGGSKPRSLYATVDAGDELIDLQARHERLCQKVGLPAESRKFKPHVTLARLGSVRDIDLANYLAVRGEFKSENIRVSHCVLYSARDSVGGGPYKVEGTYEFDRRV